MDQEQKAMLYKIIIDAVCFLLVALPILLFYLFGQPYERGFFCDDESLRHPFKESTVPTWCLYIFGLCVPCALIIVTELLTYKSSSRQSKMTIWKFDIEKWIIEVYRKAGVFLFGAALNQTATDIGKYMIGRLRPHFFDVCKPDIDCSNVANHNTYFLRYTCTGVNSRLLKDARLSFPSGHSSLSFYAAVYFTLYLQSRMHWKGSKLLKYTLQYIALLMAFSTALSRISDYKHHWSDVLSGSILGIIVALCVAIFISDLRGPGSSCNSQEIEDPEGSKILIYEADVKPSKNWNAMKDFFSPKLF